MFPIERYEIILNTVKEKKFITIKELLKLTSTSIATLRRDIGFLHRDGKINKNTGGISYRQTDHLESDLYIFNRRVKTHHEEKVVIGKAAQDFITYDEVIFLFSGTTVLEVAKAIDENKHLTVITNGLDILSVLRNKPNVEVILLGGVVNYSQNMLTGPFVKKILDDLHPSKMVTGAGGITEEKGVTNFDFTSFIYYKKLIEEVDELIVVADHSKFGKTVLIQSIPFNKIDLIITDNGISQEFIDLFVKFEKKYVIAETAKSD